MRILILVTCLTLAACGVSEPDDAPAARDAESRDPSVFDPLTSTLDRAAGVEDTLRDSAAARRRQLEEAEGR